MKHLPSKDIGAFLKASHWEGRPFVPKIIHENIKEVIYRPFVAKTLANVPEHYKPSLISNYNDKAASNAVEANIWLRESVSDAFPTKGISLNADYDEINDRAKYHANTIREHLSRRTKTQSSELLEHLLKYCNHACVVAPQCRTLSAVINRLTNPTWWKRAISKQIMRTREHGAIKCGFVHRNKGLYASDDAVELHRQRKIRSLKWLEEMEAINENGEILNLKAIAQSNTSNPEKRRIELAVRAKGQEDYAIELGYHSLFLTITAPSAYHCRAGNISNKKYNGASPRDTSQYLGGQFKKIRAKLARNKINYFGIRIVEPHHDATPHWHLMVHVEKHKSNELIAIFREYALEHYPNETGAKKHRFTVERIDPTRGSAVGYILKYISKNIDGNSVGEDFESNGENASSTSERVNAWARTNGIRQFQTFGDCPVTIYRELRKLRITPECEAIQPHWQAADVGSFGDYIKAMVAAPISLWKDEIPSTHYTGETTQVIKGLCINGEYIKTREHTWILRQKSEAFASRINVNNCTEILKRDRKKAVSINDTASNSILFGHEHR